MIRTSVPFTAHARCRCAKRGLTPAQVLYVLDHGEIISRAGATWFFLQERHLSREDKRNDTWAKLVGTAVCTAENGAVITLYRPTEGRRHIRKKMKYDCRPRRWR